MKISETETDTETQCDHESCFSFIHISHIFNATEPGSFFFCTLNGCPFSLFCPVIFLPIGLVVKVNSCNLHATCSLWAKCTFIPLNYSTYFHCVDTERIQGSTTRCLMHDLRVYCVKEAEHCDFLAALRMTTFSLLLLKPTEEQFKFLALCP